VGFYLLSVALLHVPAVQRGVTFLISEALKDILHTELSIGRVDLGYFNRIILDDVRIKDQKKKDLLKAARLSAKIELTSLLHGKISISNVQLYGFDIRLYQRTQKEKPNFQFLIDTFAKKDSLPSNPNLRIIPYLSGGVNCRGTVMTSLLLPAVLTRTTSCWTKSAPRFH